MSVKKSDRLHDYEISALLVWACHGRHERFSPKKAWEWLEEGDIESLRYGEMTIFHIMSGMDSVQARGANLDPSGHCLPFSLPEFPIKTKKDSKAMAAKSAENDDRDARLF